MVFPAESAAQARRRMVRVCQDHVRKVVEVVREILLLLTSYQNKAPKEVESHYVNVVKLEEEAMELKRTLMIELTDAGAILMSREDFLRLAAISSEIADFAGGIAFRIAEMSSHKWKVDKDVLKDLTNLAEATFNAITRLRETYLSLSYTAARTHELAKNVETAEHLVDTLYRKTDLKIVGSKMKLPAILILRDVAQLLEEIADKAEDAADAARILALSAF